MAAVLRRRQEFLAVARQGKKWVATGLILQVGAARPEQTSSPVRYGLTASGKIGNAVVRNRARRRMRALVHEIMPLHAARGYDYVLIARVSTPRRKYADLQQDLITALKKLGVWRDK